MPESTDRCHYHAKKKALSVCMCVKIGYTIIRYIVIFFACAFAHSGVNKPNMHEQHGGTSEGDASFLL